MIKDKEINESALRLYNKLIEKPLVIKKIFEDYFEEQNVDLWLPSYEDFIDFLENHTIDKFTLPPHEELSLIQKSLIDLGVSDVTLVSNYALIENLGPALLPSIGELMAAALNMYIVVHFPSVTVTNEYNKSVDIQDVFIRQEIIANGGAIYRPELTRSTLTKSQFLSGYVHSHVPSSIDRVPEFSYICIGSGPINSTISSLTVSYDEDLWKLYCVELDNLVRVESIAGTPYIRMESIIENRQECIKDFNMNTSILATSNPIHYASSIISTLDKKSFIKYIISNNVIPFNYANGQYGIGLSFIETVVKISNAFIDWYNSLGSSKPIIDLFYSGILFKGNINGNAIYKKVNQGTDSSYTRFQNTTMFTFKGKTIRFRIIDDTCIDTNSSIFININYIEDIVRALLTILNIGYGRENNCIDKETKFI